MTSRGIVSGSRIVSGEERADRSRRIAGGLAQLGIGPGDCVALLMRNDIAFVEATLATMTLGAYAVPINWHFAPEEIAHILKDCGARVLIGHNDLLHPIGAILTDTITVLGVAVPSELQAAYPVDAGLLGLPPRALPFESWLAAQPLHDGPPLPQPQSMIYTSGTTGHPKGVRRLAPTPAEHATLEAMRRLVYGLAPGRRTLLPGPLYHSAPNAFGVRAALSAEVLVLMPRFEPERLLAHIASEKIDTILMVPTMFIRLLKLPEAVRRAYDVSSLRHVIHAAAPCPVEVKRAMIDWWGPVICEFYGGTESGALTYVTSVDALRKPGTVGRPVPGAVVRILDDTGHPLPAGEIGEVFGRIENYPDFTYNNRPDERAAVERDGLITCGDVGWLDADGYLFLCDRKRDMVISGGVNIYPAEIEAVLLGLPGVRDCAVFGIPDAEFGEAVMAVVEPLPGATLDPATVHRGLAPHLAGYKLPKQIEIRSGLPREDSGKIFKRRLRDPYWAATGRQI
jgi:long-chain acyl-CoA synthetase